MKNIIFIFAQTLLLFALISCKNTNNNNYTTIDGFAQGGTYHIVFEEPANKGNYCIPDSLDKYFNQINKSLSGYDSTSVLSKINRGENPKLDSLFVECFNISKQVYNNTDGLFDITAAPLFDIWGFGFKNKEAVTQQKIDSILQFVGMEKVSIEFNKDENAYYLHKDDPRIKLNFNAIAQGFTCDYIGEEFEKMGIKNYLIEVGGEIMCKGLNDKNKMWKVGIDKPLDGNFIPGQTMEAIIMVSNQGLVTSGNYRKFYIENGEKFSHTINPKTGYPVKHNLLSATVVAKTSSIADAYATYLMVIGLEKGKEFINSREDMDALMVYGSEETMKVYSTKGIIKE